ncbi:MAG: FAD-dependent oxidoreductase [Marivita sp.]|uniref:FAD-dependent oxidoreductase n=1 Tax=Marivita sp. TaxID=2003365 RepID=UPI0025B8416C|nr:FAD-dependent oxidoreductase [Marivita sp.]MCI5109688.1 FAD-dependent oxidoreductase [Marivita sp.]
MAEQAKVVIIGGGVIGCSIAYHLAKKGWSDVILCERDELTAGATTHAVGNVILYTLDPTVSKLNQYSVDLYPTLEAETGMVPGFHQCGNMRLATDPARLDEFHRYMDVAAATGVNARLLSAGEVAEIYPFLETEGLLGAILNPDDGYASPADLAQSLAAGARQQGVQFRRGCEVSGLTQEGDGWIVKTSHGVIEAEHVVSATGNFSQRTARMLGRDSHSVPVRHQYVITEPFAALTERRKAGLPELPVFRDPEQSFYVRQEGDCLLMGAYDGRGEAMFVDDVPESHGRDPLPDELDKLLPFFERAMERLPVLEELGLHSIINSPMPYTPDDLPTCGPAEGVKNLWLAEGNPFGITLAGGIGWQMAEWIVEGEPSIDMWSCDSRRFGAWAGRKWSARKVEEAYEHTYLLPKPGEELQAGRGLRCSPLHDLLAARGAIFGALAGWERPNWFAPEGMEREEVGSFDRANWFEIVGAECQRPWNGPVLVDTSSMARFRVKGTGTQAVLANCLSGSIPAETETNLVHMKSPGGGVVAEFTIHAEAAGSFLLTCGAQAETYAWDLLQRAVADAPDVSVENLTGRLGGLHVFGKGAEDALAQLGGAYGYTTIGLTPVRIAPLNAFGLPGWSLTCPAEQLRRVFLTLETQGIGLIGARALEALRVEQGLPAWPTEWNRETDPADARSGKLVHLRVTPKRGAPLGREPIRDKSGRVVGATTSGSWGHLSGAGYALGFVEAGTPTEGLEVQLMNTWHPAEPVSAT